MARKHLLYRWGRIPEHPLLTRENISGRAWAVTALEELLCEVLVTGGCGFLGSHVCEYLHELGWDVILTRPRG